MTTTLAPDIIQALQHPPGTVHPWTPIMLNQVAAMLPATTHEIADALHLHEGNVRRLMKHGYDLGIFMRGKERRMDKMRPVLVYRLDLPTGRLL